MYARAPLSRATRRGAGLAGVQPAGRPPAPAEAGPRERGRLGLRLSLSPPSYVRQLCSRQLRAFSPYGPRHRSLNLPVVAEESCGAEGGGEAGPAPLH